MHVSASQPRRFRRLLAGLAGVAVVAVSGLTLMSGPAGATEGDSGRIDTAATTVETQSGALTRGGGDKDCTGDECKRINWCKGGKDLGDKTPVIQSDAPAVRFGGDKGEKPKCIKKPDMSYKCCVPDKNGTADVVVTVKNPNHKGGYKVRATIDGKSQEKWVDAGQTVEFIFTGLGNGKYKVETAVWTGKGGTWCVFKECPIIVKCAVKTTPPTTPPTTVPTTVPTTAPTTVPTTTPPTSNSPSVTPSATVTTSTTPVPGGGGGDNEPSLPVTGSSTGWVAGAGALLVLAGAGALLFMRRRRQVRFSA